MLYGRNLQVIRISEDSVVLKRGVLELLLSGSAVLPIVESLVAMLDGRHTREQIVSAFPESLQPEAENLLTTLRHRGLVSDEPEPGSAAAGGDAFQDAFWWNFGEMGRQAPARLREAQVLVVGVNLITRSLVRSLLEMGIGRITLVDHPILDHRPPPVDGAGSWPPQAERLQRREAMPGAEELADVSLICAASDLGDPEALLDINRVALQCKKPYLPVWLADLVGYVGPLNYPCESACLRCYQLRADSNNPDWQVARAIRRQLSSDAGARQGAGMLPPMTGALGEVAAMEIVKCLGRFAPGDVVGRVIEVNLISFASSVRRVLKIPRCPECSEMMHQGSKALTVGFHIPRPDESDRRGGAQ